MPETRLDGYKIIDDREDRERPEEQPRSGNVAAHGEPKAKEAGNAEEAEVDAADGLDGDAGIGGMRHADPEEIDTEDCVPDEVARMSADGDLGLFALLLRVGDLADALVALKVGRGFGHGESRSPGEAVVREQRGLV